jgi:hypothetical protein
MDNVRVNIQNKDLIKELIESNPDLEVKINNAIIDGVSKRVLKNVLNQFDTTLNRTFNEVSEKISKEFLDFDNSSWWQKRYNLKDDYKNHIRDIVRQTWFEEMYDDVSKVKEQILQDYKTSLQMACSKYVQQVENATNNIDERIEKAVAKYFKERLGK